VDAMEAQARQQWRNLPADVRAACGQRAMSGDIAGYLAGVAAMLGSAHGRAGTRPYGDLERDGEAGLMNALGEVSPTTEANAPLRLALTEAYVTAYEAAAQYRTRHPNRQRIERQLERVRAGYL
jgi:hypothetical protein